ncbi:MAG TPA: ABC transporter ATP-binding protein [Acidimicrobiales bacterium]|nr:ABC transporter ATP-binding protein [Acidimicrobiales bacterium]
MAAGGRLFSLLAVSSRADLVRASAGVAPGLTAALATLVVAAGLLPAAFSLATGALAQAIPDAVGRSMGSPSGHRVAVALLVATSAYVLIQVAGPVRAMVGDILMRRIDATLAVDLMRAVSAPRGIAHLEDPQVLDRVAQAQGAVHGATVGGTVTYLGAVWTLRIQGLAALVILSRFRWWLALVVAAGHVVSLRWRRRHWLAITQVVFDRTDGLRQADYLRRLAIQPQAAKECQVFSLSSWLVDRYRESFLATMEPVWRERSSGLSPAMGVALLMLALDAGALALVARAGVQGSIGLGAAVVYAQAVLGAAALSTFDLSHVRLEDGLASLRILRGLQAAVPEAVQNLRGGTPAAGLPERVIRFEGVRFRYPGRDEDVFDGLDLDIVAGESLAIVGTNGAGKTTLIKLLARLYDVDGGRITVDGIDLRDLDPAAWQRRVAAIFQDFVRYPVSAHDNVAFGALSSRDRSAVEHAARRAGALDLVTALPKGWDTVLNRQFTDGADLSGGEWQRIALARALFAVSAGAGVLVLDEPTASLDVRAEAGLYDRFLDLTRGVTTIVVSHRFSTVRRAQRIVVLEHGRVVEDGSHDELVAAGGRYASMYALQASRFWVESDDDG